MGAGGRPDPSAALPAVSEHAWRRGSMMGLSLWTQLFNHGAFAALFLWRALTQVGAASEELSLERSMIAEVGTACYFLGCDPEYILPNTVKVMGRVLDKAGTSEASAASFMYFYMSLEGVLHLGICAGAALMLLRRGGVQTYRLSLLAELIIMDVFYCVIFTAVPYGCIRYPGECIDNLGTPEIGGFVEGAHFACFIVTVAWLQHVSVLLDVVAWYVLRAEVPAAPAARKGDLKVH